MKHFARALGIYSILIVFLCCLFLAFTFRVYADDAGNSGKSEPDFIVLQNQEYSLAVEEPYVITKKVPYGLTLHYRSEDNSKLIFPDDTDPHFIGLAVGWVTVTVTSEETETYYSVSKTTDIYLYKQAQNIGGAVSITENFSAGGYQMDTHPWRIYTDYTVTSSNEAVAEVDKSGYITFKKPGTAIITVSAVETDKYLAGLHKVQLKVLDDRKTQTITGPSSVNVEFGQPVVLDMSAQTGLSYKSSNTSVAVVNDLGEVTFSCPGTVTIMVTAAENDEYKSATKSVTVTATGETPGGDQSQQGGNSTDTQPQTGGNTDTQPQTGGSTDTQPQTGGNTATQPQTGNTGGAQVKPGAGSTSGTTRAGISVKKPSGKTAVSKKKTAKKSSLKKPVLKCKRGRHKNKLFWNKINGALGYQLFIKYPGSKKFVKALTKEKTVKSVTHKGLTKGAQYKYKIRAYAKKGKKTYYSPFSKVITAKAK